MDAAEIGLGRVIPISRISTPFGELPDSHVEMTNRSLATLAFRDKFFAKTVGAGEMGRRGQGR